MVTLVLGGCASQGNAVVPTTGTIVTVTMHGGECATVPCDSSVYLDADGHAHISAKPPNDLGQVPANVMTTLTAAISHTDFTALRSHPFTSSCPTATDGHELIFEFTLAGGTERISSCEVAIDWGSPLFVALAAALAQWVPMPVT